MKLLTALTLFTSIVFAIDQDNTFTIALRQNLDRVQDLKQTLFDISDPTSYNYGKYLTANEINHELSYQDDISLVNIWLKENNVDCDFLGDAFKCRLNSNRITELFGVTYSSDMTPLSNYVIPKELQNAITFIEGLSNTPRNAITVKKSRVIPNTKDVDPGAITREVVKRVYNIPDNSKHLKQYHILDSSVGPIEFMSDTGYSSKDLNYSQFANDLSKNPVRPNHQIGPNDQPWDTESQLDIQIINWIANDAPLWFVVTDSWIYSWAVDFLNRKTVPYVVSLSYGWNEIDQCTLVHCNGSNSLEYVLRSNVELMKLGLRGISVLV